MDFDYARRFGGVARLYGEAGLAALAQAHVGVVGIGGVGSWAVEALARSAVGQLTLIDLDMVAESNTNRQLHAMAGVYGKAKVDAMAERILAINPACTVHCIEDFVTADNLPEMLDRGFDVVIDAIDQARVKIAMIAWCKRRKLPIVVAGAAGGQIDPTQVQLADLSQTVQDPLLAKVRASLRREHGFPRQGKMGVSCVYSNEALRYPDKNATCDTGSGPAGLNCAGFGSSACVTSVFGFAAASQAIKLITG